MTEATVRATIPTLVEGGGGLFGAERAGGTTGPVAEIVACRPGAGRVGGPALALSYGFHPSPFGEALLVACPDGLVGLGFVDGDDRRAALDDMRGRWPAAAFDERPDRTASLAGGSFEAESWASGAPTPVVLVGTAFETAVWTALLGIPLGRTTTYSALAAHLGRPTASRAIGAAVGRNPISFVVPCHRVVGRSGHLTGYYWGLPRKAAMLGWEAARFAA